jgi:hypothetical protein
MPEVFRAEGFVFFSRAVKAFAENGMVGIGLADGREIRFPAAKNRRLRQATPA